MLPLVAAAQTAPARLPQDAIEQTINLSPFVVSADSIDGYTASQTLSGTRLRTDARDIGAAMTILTPEFLDDIGATDITSVYDFVPSTETYNLSATDTDGNGSRSRDTVTVRGFNSSSLSLNQPSTARSGPRKEIFVLQMAIRSLSRWRSWTTPSLCFSPKRGVKRWASDVGA